MKFILVALAVASTVFGVPTEEKRNGCTPGTYACTANKGGWQVCDTSRVWEFGGSCPPKTVCFFDTVNASPYCIPPGFHIP